jgi:hypothetical protein
MVSEWLAANLDAAALELLSVDVNPTTTLLPRGHRPCEGDRERWTELAIWLATRPGRVIVDAGTGQPPPALGNAADHILLVTRPCYLALRRAVSTSRRPTGIVLISEPGRALHPVDVERAVGVPVVTHLDLDPALARAVDAGLLAAHLPRSLHRRLALPPDQPMSAPSRTPGASADHRETTAPRLCSIASIQTGDSGPRPVTVEVHVAHGPFGYEGVGVGDQACQASWDRIRAAFTASGLVWPDMQITVNVMPAGHGTPEPALDVAIAAGILAATGRLDRTTSSSHAYVGQLGLDGSIIAVPGLDRTAVEHVTGLPAANCGHLRDLANRTTPGITPVRSEPSSAGQIAAGSHQTRTADPSAGLGGIG